MPRGYQRRQRTSASAASVVVAAASSSASAAGGGGGGGNKNSSAGKNNSSSSADPFDLEDELAALDAAVLDDLAEAGALADLSRGGPSSSSPSPDDTRAAVVERPVPTDPSKRHRKRRSGEKALSAAFLRALTEEAMSGGGGDGDGEGAEFPSYEGFAQLGGDEDEEEDEEDGFLLDDDDDDDNDNVPSTSTSSSSSPRLRPGAGDVLTQDELDSAPPGFRAGYVALVGRPNAGKSTLLNALLGRKLSIVTPKAQTTRQRVLGIASGQNCQMVLLDTPGLLKGDKAPNALDRRMAAAVSKATADADAVLALVDASAPGAAGAAQEAVAKLVVAAAVGAAAARSKEKEMKKRSSKKSREKERAGGVESSLDEEEEEEAARALEAVRITLGAARRQGDGGAVEEEEEEEEEDGIDDEEEEESAVSPIAALAAANAAAAAAAAGPSSSSSHRRTPVAILLNKVDAAAPGRVDELEAVVRRAVGEAAGEVRAAVAAARAEAAKKRRGRGGGGQEENADDSEGEEDEEEELLFSESDFDVPVFRTCALNGSGVAAAADWAAGALPESPPLYPSHLLADAPERFFVAEIVREKIFLLYREEVPYACAVEVTEYIEREGGAKDYAAISIFVERQQQKGILLGAGGSALKRLGAAARADAEVFLGRPLYMEISVKVAPKWRSDDRTVRQFGY